MHLSKASALGIATMHITEQAARSCRQITDYDVREGWPGAIYRAQDSPDEVWAVTVPDTSPRVGGSRVLVISKATGKVWSFDNVGD